MYKDISELAHASDAMVEQRIRARRFPLQEFYSAVDSHIGSRIRLIRRALSFEGRPINVLSFGHGPVKVLAWSQMHGNEPVSTMALMDVISYLDSGSPEAQSLASRITLVMIPMLNPDGHAIHDRRGAQGIDINRDAQDSTTPEAGLLWEAYNSIRAEYALNLHDMEIYYTSRPALRQTALALLAPECDAQGSLTDARRRAMAVAGHVYTMLQPLAPQRIARYHDTYTPSAFGDSLMSRGTASILIEAGASPRDPERTEARRLMRLAIISALGAMALGAGEQMVEAYNAMPLNIRYGAFDLLLENLEVSGCGRTYRVSVGIRRVKPTFNGEDFTDDFADYRIANIGNLANFGAIIRYDASRCRLASPYTSLRIGHKADFCIETAAGDVVNVRTLLN